jgi:hypothetical protein
LELICSTIVSIGIVNAKVTPFASGLFSIHIPAPCAGSTVTITGEIADDEIESGQQILVQIFNPENAPYRFDPLTPESDGSYSYSLVIGGPLGINGEWQVKVTYGKSNAEETFQLTGGFESSTDPASRW